MRFKRHGVYTEAQKIKDLQDTVRDLNEIIADIESKLNAMQAQIDGP